MLERKRKKSVGSVSVHVMEWWGGGGRGGEAKFLNMEKKITTFSLLLVFAICAFSIETNTDN